MRRPLVLTGGPAAGKTTTGRRLAEGRPRAAFVDVDDVRQLVVAGAEPLWGGEEGVAQHRLAALNACVLARSFVRHRFDVVIADVLTPQTARVYRSELPDCLLVHLVVPFAEAQRRAGMRLRWLTDEEFRELHRNDARWPPEVDHRLEVKELSFEEQLAVVDELWTGCGRSADSGDR